MAEKLKHFIAVIITISCLELAKSVVGHKRCLTGHMTDVQKWVSDDGSVIIREDSKWGYIADVSRNSNPVPVLRRKLLAKRSKSRQYTILNMANCSLKTVPEIFNFTDAFGTRLADSVVVITFYGNRFDDFGFSTDNYDAKINATMAKKDDFAYVYGRKGITTWPLGFRNTNFTKLKELDLRNCSIQSLSDGIFSGMPVLEALYLSGNNLFYVSTSAFQGLISLTHLDLSNNVNKIEREGEVYFESDNVFKKLNKLASLDLSFTKFGANRVGVLRLGKSLERLSICYAAPKLLPKIFEDTSLKVLDVSGNTGILERSSVLDGVQDQLEILFAENIGIRNVNIFQGFKQLRLINLDHNEINSISKNITNTWQNLRVLLLNNNRMTTWFEDTFSSIKDLSMLSLKNNNINVIKPQMLQDIHDIEYLAMSGNFFVCNCYAREFVDISDRNLKKGKNYHVDIDGVYNAVTKLSVEGSQLYHTARDLLDTLLEHLNSEVKIIDMEIDKPRLYSGNFTLLDNNMSAYECLSAQDGYRVPFSKIDHCDLKRDINYETVIQAEWNKLLLLIIPALTIILVALGYYYRWNVKYCWLTMKNSIILSSIDGMEVSEDTIYSYDVFVSYCNDDRPWVLDELLPQLENSCNVSVCLHERDFQVGLSILENIVSCMDRSKSIMLVISKKFLLSQWCQFEMHLAQHRLLETRREDLILILLEEVPRRLRPNTLHYLMLTKTYVQWPKEQSERNNFWRRLKKSVYMQKNKRNENSSLS